MSNNSPFKNITPTGDIQVMTEAKNFGFKENDLSWSNLGTGSPETAIPSSYTLENQVSLEFDPTDKEYGPVAGLDSLRNKIAAYYNSLYRQNCSSKYTYENVCICSGARLALTRVIAAMGNHPFGYFVPDNSAYEELLQIKSIETIPFFLNPEFKYQLSLQQIEQDIQSKGIKCILKSNPNNPTGQVLMGKSLESFVNTVIKTQCSLVLDEAYSHYLYNTTNNNYPQTVSAAQYVSNVNEDPVLIINGLSKNWRLPGFRLAWIIGPKHLIDTMINLGSFLDGGANVLAQRLASSLFEPNALMRDINALQHHFQHKRDVMIQRLQTMGIETEVIPSAGFYLWVNLSKLAKPLNDATHFFRQCLMNKVIVVPGKFFDLNPGKTRKDQLFSSYCRLSFGPDLNTIKRGMDQIEKMISSLKTTRQRNHDFELALVQKEEQKHEIYRLRYDAALSLGYQHPNMDSTRKIFTDSFDDKAVTIAAYHDGKAIGTIRGVIFKDFSDVDLELINKYRVFEHINGASVENSIEINRFVVSKDYQKYGVATLLMIELFNKSLKQNPFLQHIFILCKEDLVRYEEFYGFKKIGAPLYSEIYKTYLYSLHLEAGKIASLLDAHLRAHPGA